MAKSREAMGGEGGTRLNIGPFPTVSVFDYDSKVTNDDERSNKKLGNFTYSIFFDKIELFKQFKNRSV